MGKSNEIIIINSNGFFSVEKVQAFLMIINGQSE